MENLNNYIQEKLKINSKTKVNTLLDRVISLLVIPESIQNKVTDKINDWINGNLPHNKKKIEGVVPIAYPITIEILIDNGVNKEITDEYAKNNPLENCEMCEDEYNNSYLLYNDEMYEIRYNESILTFINTTVEHYSLYLYNEKRLY